MSPVQARSPSATNSAHCVTSGERAWSSLPFIGADALNRLLAHRRVLRRGQETRSQHAGISSGAEDRACARTIEQRRQNGLVRASQVNARQRWRKREG